MSARRSSPPGRWPRPSGTATASRTGRYRSPNLLPCPRRICRSTRGCSAIGLVTDTRRMRPSPPTMTRSLSASASWDTGLVHYARFNYGVTTGGRGGGRRPTLVGALRALDLLHNKHIPTAYLRASARQRAQLLAGLLDADGTCAVRANGNVLSGQVSFSNSDRRLIDASRRAGGIPGFHPDGTSGARGEVGDRPVLRGVRQPPARCVGRQVHPRSASVRHWPQAAHARASAGLPAASYDPAAVCRRR